MDKQFAISLLNLENYDLDLETIISRSESQYEKSNSEKQIEINYAATLLINEYNFSDIKNAKIILKLTQNDDENNLKKIIQRSEECMNNYLVPIIKQKSENARNLLLLPFRVLDSKAEVDEGPKVEGGRNDGGNKSGLKETYNEYKIIINSLIVLFSLGLLFWVGSNRWFNNVGIESKDTTAIPSDQKDTVTTSTHNVESNEIETDDRNNLIITTTSNPVAINVKGQTYYDRQVKLNGKGKYNITEISFIYHSPSGNQIIYKSVDLDVVDNYATGEMQTTQFLNYLQEGILATVKIGNGMENDLTTNEFLQELYSGNYELSQINYKITNNETNEESKGVTKVKQ